MEYPIIIKEYNNIKVLRDDTLKGGTKSILMPYIIDKNKHYVYASPVYGAFQIALSYYCGKNCTIFCAKRKVKHCNTLKCIEYGANVIEIDYGYLSVIEKKAKEYCEKEGYEKLIFGGNTDLNKQILSKRVKEVIEFLGKEPEEIWVAIGSGTLVESILLETRNSNVFGVQVGKEYLKKHDRLKVYKYHKSFEKESKYKAQFQSMFNYDLKAFEYCNLYKKSKDVLFWNVF